MSSGSMITMTSWRMSPLLFTTRFSSSISEPMIRMGLRIDGLPPEVDGLVYGARLEHPLLHPASNLVHCLLALRDPVFDLVEPLTVFQSELGPEVEPGLEGLLAGHERQDAGCGVFERLDIALASRPGIPLEGSQPEVELEKVRPGLVEFGVPRDRIVRKRPARIVEASRPYLHSRLPRSPLQSLGDYRCVLKVGRGAVVDDAEDVIWLFSLVLPVIRVNRVRADPDIVMVL